MVAGVLGVVGVLVVPVGVLGVVAVEVVVVVVEVEVEVVPVIVGVLVVLLDVVSVAVPTAAPQSWRASVRTVAAPRLRSDTSVGLTDPGRAATSVWMLSISRSALTQSPFEMSAEELLSCEFSELASLDESRPELAPQAARNAAASPRPAARRARGT